MSCYNNREKSNFFALKTSSGAKYMSFTDTRTAPETMAFLLRNFLSDGMNSVKRRAFQMFMMLNQYTSGKPDVTGDLINNYSEIIRAIFKPFINGYGKYDNEMNYNKELNKMRFSIITYLKRITGCGDVNVIFKSSNSTPLNDEINCYINDSETGFGNPFVFKIDNTGIKLKETATITVSIPLRFIENTIGNAYYKCVENFNKEKVKLESIDSRLNDAILSYIESSVTKKFFKSLICALYKEQIFTKFAQDTITLSSIFLKTRNPETIEKIDLAVDSRNTTPSLNLKVIAQLLKDKGVNELNPHLLLDVFEVFDSEMTLFINSFVRDSENVAIQSPKYCNLQQDPEDYIDIESRISASIVYVTKLNYCILALMMLTKNSIKESSRAPYCDMISNGLNYAKSASHMAQVTNNKEYLINEVKTQLNTMKELASNIINLKRLSEKVE